MHQFLLNMHLQDDSLYAINAYSDAIGLIFVNTQTRTSKCPRYKVTPTTPYRFVIYGVTDTLPGWYIPSLLCASLKQKTLHVCYIGQSGFKFFTR